MISACGNRSIKVGINFRKLWLSFLAGKTSVKELGSRSVSNILPTSGVPKKYGYLASY